MLFTERLLPLSNLCHSGHATKNCTVCSERCDDVGCGRWAQVGISRGEWHGGGKAAYEAKDGKDVLEAQKPSGRFYGALKLLGTFDD